MVSDRKPGGYWSVSPALGLVVFICTAAVFYVGWDFIALETAQRVSERYDREADETPSDGEIAELCASRSEPERVQCAIDETKAREKWDEDRRDLNAQEGMEFWAKWMFMAALAGTIVAGYGLVLLRRTWVEAKRTADVAREIGEAQVRAYLDVYDISLIFTPPNGGLAIQLRLKNLGQSPAKAAAWRYDIGFSVGRSTIYRDVADDPVPIGVVPPTFDEFILPAGHHDTTVHDAISRIKKGLILVHVRIYVTYADVFGNSISDEFAYTGRMVVENSSANVSFKRLPTLPV